MSKYNILYIYDLTPHSKKEEYKLKRRFYYHLNKFKPFIRKATKSTFLTTKEHEKHLDEFFLSFNEGSISVYKCKVSNMEILKN